MTTRVMGASSANLPGWSAADTSLFEFFAGVTTTLTDGGTGFTLGSIDLAPLIAGGSGTFMVTIDGTLADSSTVSQTLTVSDGTPAALQTFALSGFTGVVSVSFAQGTNSGFFGAQDTAYQFDNLVLNPVTGATPEPASMTLLGIGLAVLMVLIRRRMA